MAIDSELTRWASEDQLDPISGDPNKLPISTEFRNSGLMEDQGLPLEWLNEQLNNQHATNVELQEQLNNIVGASSLPTLQFMMPIGFIWQMGVYVEPSTYFGFGTWVRIQGKVLVGVDDSDIDFDTVGEEGGAKTHTHSDNFTVDGTAITVAQLPSETPFTLDVSNTAGGETQSATIYPLAGDNVTSTTSDNKVNWEGNGDLHSHSTSGGVQSSSNVMPYKTVYIWQRTA